MPERKWVRVDRGRQFRGLRHNLMPWWGTDQYQRTILVLPYWFGSLVIAIGRRQEDPNGQD